MDICPTYQRCGRPAALFHAFLRRLGHSLIGRLGLVPTSFQFTARNPSVKIVLHAISIDERRAFFRQNRLLPVDGQDLLQRWFPGVHCDVGGGYEQLISDAPPVYSRLWLRPFQWMLDESRAAGLFIDEDRLKSVLAVAPTSENAWVDPQHESLTPLWWPVEWFPKLRYYSELNRRLPHLNRGRPRVMIKGEMIDEWALRRIRDANYTPPNLSAGFCAFIRALREDQIPEFISYEP